MAKPLILMTRELLDPAHRIHDGEQLRQAPRHERSEGVLCKFKAAGEEYLKYTVSGVNILCINLMILVVFTIFNAEVLRSHFPNAFIP